MPLEVQPFVAGNLVLVGDAKKPATSVRVTLESPYLSIEKSLHAVGRLRSAAFEKNFVQLRELRLPVLVSRLIVGFDVIHEGRARQRLVSTKATMRVKASLGDV